VLPCLWWNKDYQKEDACNPLKRTSDFWDIYRTSTDQGRAVKRSNRSFIFTAWSRTAGLDTLTCPSHIRPYSTATTDCAIFKRPITMHAWRSPKDCSKNWNNWRSSMLAYVFFHFILFIYFHNLGCNHTTAKAEDTIQYAYMVTKGRMCRHLHTTNKTEQDAQLSQRDRAAGCVIVFAKSGRLELGDNILQTL